MVTFDGDSVAPLLSSGDRLLINIGQQVPVAPGIFVIGDGMGLVAKRVGTFRHGSAEGADQVDQSRLPGQ